jgi:hypothetical protein
VLIKKNISAMINTIVTTSGVLYCRQLSFGMFRNTPNWAHWWNVITINLIYGEKFIA